MKKYILLFTLAFAGSLLVALTVGGQSHEYEDSTSVSPSSTLAAPAENDTSIKNNTPTESHESSSLPAAKPHPTQETHGVANSALGHQQMLLSSTTIVGATVKNAQGETIGDIQEVMIDPETGNVTYAMVTHSGQWGMGKQKSFAVPWEDLKIAFNKTDVVVELQEDKLLLPTHVELSQR